MLKHTFFLSPSFPPTLSHAPSIARHAADELKESMSVGRQGGEKRKKEDIRKNSFSEFLNKKHGLNLRRLVSFRGLGGGYLGQPFRGRESTLICLLSTFNLGEQKHNKKQGACIDKLGLSVHGVPRF